MNPEQIHLKFARNPVEQYLLYDPTDKIAIKAREAVATVVNKSSFLESFFTSDELSNLVLFTEL